ncbi:hypothetical protein DIPPA_58107 [Diplonema papillatum]|nr:hypothetical protein DIPPA_58107 [Diplonema papillatum]
MLLRIGGDGVSLALIKAAGQDPAIDVNPSHPFSDTVTSRKFATLLGCSDLPFDQLGVNLYIQNPDGSRGPLVDVSQPPERQGVKPGSFLHLVRDTVSSAGHISSGHVTPAEYQPAPANWGTALSSQLFHNTPAVDVEVGEAPQSVPKSMPWDEMSQMEEAAKKRAQHIMRDFQHQKNRVAELELELAKAQHDSENGRRVISELQQRLNAVKVESAGRNAAELDDLRSQNYTLKKDVLELRKANVVFDRKEREISVHLGSLQSGVEAAEERGRNTSEKMLAAVQEDLAEANTFIDALKERLIAQAAEIKTLANPTRTVPHTEHIILPPGMLRKLVNVSGSGMQYFRERYNIEVALQNNTMTVIGNPFQINLFKEECERHLGLTQPDVAAKSEPEPCQSPDRSNKELHSEIERLSNELRAARSTVDSLHLALQHAQMRIETDLEAARVLRIAQTQELRQREQELAALREQTEDLNAELQAKSNALDDANNALASTIEAFKGEFEKMRDSTEECSKLRLHLSRTEADMKCLQESHFETVERLNAQSRADSHRSSGRLVDESCPQLKKEVETPRRELRHMSQRFSEERAALEEKNRCLQEALRLEECQRGQAELYATDLGVQPLSPLKLTDDLQLAHLRDVIDHQKSEIVDLTATAAEWRSRHDVLLTGLQKPVGIGKPAALPDCFNRDKDSQLIVSQPGVHGNSALEALRAELRDASLRSLTATPVLPAGKDATALVSSIRAELEAKKAQLTRSQVLLSTVGMVHPYSLDLSPAKPLSPSSTAPSSSPLHTVGARPKPPPDSPSGQPLPQPRAPSPRTTPRRVK